MIKIVGINFELILDEVLQRTNDSNIEILHFENLFSICRALKLIETLIQNGCYFPFLILTSFTTYLKS
jgi:hypothetical protein